MQTHPQSGNPPASNKDTSVDMLQQFLKAELSAVETYELALGSITHVGVRHALQEILASHARRAELLRARVLGLANEPASGSGAWGAFAKAVQAGADILGDHVAVSALEQGEDRTLELYSHFRDEVDWGTQKFVEADLLPEERHTHELCRSLKNYTKAPS